MADWGLPSLPAPYPNFLSDLKNRDYDAISLGLNTISNPQTGMIRYVRASNIFQEYNGSVWVDKVLSVAGGGTGSNTPTGAGTALGLGNMAYQNNNNVSIIGGVISGISNLGVNGQVSSNTMVANAITSNGDIRAIQDCYADRDLRAGRNLAVTGAINAASLVTSGGINVGRIDANQLIITYTDSYARGVFRAGPSDVPITAADGTLLASRIGYGYTGSGTKVLLDNNTWGVLNVSAYISAIVEDASFEAGQATKDINIAPLGLANINELLFIHGGPTQIVDNANIKWEVSVDKPVNTSVIRLRKSSLEGGYGNVGNLPVSTHSYFAYRIRLG